MTDCITYYGQHGAQISSVFSSFVQHGAQGIDYPE